MERIEHPFAPDPFNNSERKRRRRCIDHLRTMMQPKRGLLWRNNGSYVFLYDPNRREFVELRSRKTEFAVDRGIMLADEGRPLRRQVGIRGEPDRGSR
jgi:hypothetical protein